MSLVGEFSVLAYFALPGIGAGWLVGAIVWDFSQHTMSPRAGATWGVCAGMVTSALAMLSLWWWAGTGYGYESAIVAGVGASLVVYAIISVARNRRWGVAPVGALIIAALVFVMPPLLLIGAVLTIGG